MNERKKNEWKANCTKSGRQGNHRRRKEERKAIIRET